MKRKGGEVDEYEAALVRHAKIGLNLLLCALHQKGLTRQSGPPAFNWDHSLTDRHRVESHMHA